MAEVGRATAHQGLTLAQANDLAAQPFPLYEHVFAQREGNRGLPFDQVFDLHTLRPTAQWTDMYYQAKATLKGWELAA